MLLELRDNTDKVKLIRNTETGQTAIYNPTTGKAKIIKTEALSAGIFGTKKTRQARKKGKEQRKVAKQESKTKRQAGRQERKDIRVQRGVERQENKKIKVVGKRAIIQAKQEEKLKKARGEHQELTPKQEGANEYDFDQAKSDVAPISNVPGGDFEPEDQAQDSQEDTIDIDYTEQEQDPYNEQGQNEPLYDEGLSGWVDVAFKGIQKIATKAKDSKAGKTITGAVVSQLDYNNLKNENKILQDQVKSLQNQLAIYGGGGLVVGAIAGYVVKGIVKK